MVRIRNALHVLTVACLAWACSTTPPRIHANDVVAYADSDPIRFFNDYQRKRIVVMGHVGAKQLAQRTSSSVSLVDYGPFVTGNVSPESETLPVLVFEPARRVMCYFAPSQMDAVAEVRVGERVFVECLGANLRNAPGGTIVQFSDCELASVNP